MKIDLFIVVVTENMVLGPSWQRISRGQLLRSVFFFQQKDIFCPDKKRLLGGKA